MKLINNHFLENIEDVKQITAFNKLDEIQSSQSEAIIINIHLTFNNQKLSNNYGFEIAQQLRTKHQVSAPIILYSPLPKIYFEKLSLNNPKYQILFGSGTFFLQIPSKPEELNLLLKNVKPISKSALHDVTTMLCDLKGIVSDRLNHDLKFNSNIEDVFNKVIPFLSTLQKELLEINLFKQKLIQLQKEKNATQFAIEKETFRRKSNAVFNNQNKVIINEASTKVKFKILILDDEQEVLDRLTLNLKNHFDVLPFKKANEAIIALDKDDKNEITAVIADWRLYTNNSKTYWQEKQGYDVLEHAAKNGFRALFSLTSQDEFLVNQIRNISNIKFKVFKKENIIDNTQVKILNDIIYQECEEVLKVVSGIPTATNWRKNVRSITTEKEYNKLYEEDKNQLFTKSDKNNKLIKYKKYKSLHHQYLEKLMSKEKQLFFTEIDNVADEVWEYLMYYHNNTSQKFIGVEKVRTKFNLSTPKDALLFPTLILRRIWIALWFFLMDDYNSLNSYEIRNGVDLIYMYLNNEGNENFKPASSTGEQNKLFIDLGQIRTLTFLPEEKAWLKKHELI